MAELDKCPNCGAVLKARRPGQEIRTCEYCGVELRSRTADATTPEDPRAAAQRLIDALAARRRAAEDGAPASPARSSRVPIVIAVITMLGIAAGVIAAVTAGDRARRAATVAAAGGGGASGAAAARDGARAAGDAAFAAAGGPKQLDLAKYLPFTDALAKRTFPDAQLYRLDLDMVGPSGLADLTLADNASFMVRYRSPAASRPPADAPIGVEQKIACQVLLSASPRWIDADPDPTTTDARGCREPLVLPPRCTTAEIWTRARAAGAPERAVASLRFEAIHQTEHFFSRGEPMSFDPDVPSVGLWTFDIDDRSAGTRISLKFPDLCGVPAGEPAGAPRETVRSAIRGARSALKGCWSAARKQRNATQWMALAANLALTVAADGKVKEATVTASDPAVAACIETQARKLKLPHGDAEARFTFGLVLFESDLMLGD